MPPKPKYTKEQIGDKAYEMVRKHGIEILSARGLAAELGTSTAPIFTAYKNIEELETLVINRAKALYKTYFFEGLGQELPFKGTGMKHIQFAKDEPELFKLLFMGVNSDKEFSHFLPEDYEFSETVLNTVESDYALSKENAKRLYNHLSVYTHGLAVLYAQRQCVFTMEDVSRMLKEAFMAFSSVGGAK